MTKFMKGVGVFVGLVLNIVLLYGVWYENMLAIKVSLMLTLAASYAACCILNMLVLLLDKDN